MNQELPDVSLILKKYNVALESLMASAFMTLFTNLVCNEHSSRILDRFMLGKSNQFIFCRGREGNSGYSKEHTQAEAERVS